MAAPNGLPRLERRVDERSHRRFLEVSGRRIALLGNELGVFECWIWPIKVARELELSVRTDQVRRGRDLARHVAFQPDRTEVTYVGPDFTIRQTMFAPLDRRALVMTFDVECERELELLVGFTPTFQPMWPAGMGGQVALRDDPSGAFALTEELGRFAALFGSPEAEPVDVRADHSLPRDNVSIRLPVSVARAKRGPIPFFIVGGEVAPKPLSAAALVGELGASSGHARSHEVLQAARGEYRAIVSNWRDVRSELVEHWRDFLARTTHFESDEARPTEAFLWAKIAIEKAWVEVDGLGRGLVAGLAPSGAGERPGFGWFFDGDAIVASRAMVGYGDRKGARRALDFAASHQRADGKMMHELVLSAKLCNWLEDYPYAYYKAQLTPGFISCLAHYMALTDDTELRQQLWPSVVAAYRCCIANLEKDGFLSNLTLGIAAVEAGSLVGKIRADVYLQGIWISALRGVMRMACWLQDAEVEHDAERRLAAATQLFESYWSAQENRYGFAHLVDGSLCTDSTAYNALPLSRDIGSLGHAIASASALNRPNLTSDWGARLFADDSSVYDATNYNTGSVFPYANNFVVLALYEYGLTTAAHQVLESQISLHGFSGLGFVPEHLYGHVCRTPERGVPHQIFSSACIVQSTLFGLFGIKTPDAAAEMLGGAQVASRHRPNFAQISIMPAMPPRASRLRLERFRYFDSTIDLELRRERRDGTTRLRAQFTLVEGSPLTLHFIPRLPPLSRAATTKLDTETELRPGRLSGFGGSLHLLQISVELRGAHELALDFQSGPELTLDVSPLVEGAESSRLRVCEVEFDESSVTWVVWGLAGTTYNIGVHSDRRVRFEECRRVHDSELEITFPSAPNRRFVSKKIRAIALD